MKSTRKGGCVTTPTWQQAVDEACASAGSTGRPASATSQVTNSLSLNQPSLSGRRAKYATSTPCVPEELWLRGQPTRESRSK